MPSSRRARREAETRINDQEAIVRAAHRSAARVSRSIIAHAGRLFAQGINPAQDVRAMTVEYAEVITEMSMRAHLSAASRVLNLAAQTDVVDMGLARKPSLSQEAAEFVKVRESLSAEELKAIRASYGQEAVRLTGELGADLERRVGQAVAESVTQSELQREGTKRIAQAFADAGLVPAKPFALETIFRTQTNLAYSAGQWQMNQDPAIQEILWGYEYVTAGDDRVRPEHEALDGVVLPKNDPRWAEITPPNGFNCRCTLIEVFDEGELVVPEAEVEIDGETVVPGADEGWRFHPANAIGEAPTFGGPVIVSE